MKLGGNWQIPTPAQFKELVNYCWNNGGVVFNITEHYTLYIGTTGQMIIFPYCGSRRETALIANERWGYFWTSTAYTDKQSQDYHDYTAEAYIFDSSRAFDLSCYRFQGFNVRPVINATNNSILPESSSDTSNQSIYNIYGIKVADKSTDMNTLPSGIYIVNGRKMVVK